MKKRLFFVVLLLTMSCTSVAGEFEVGVSYSNISIEQIGNNIDLSGSSLIGSYTINPQAALSHVVEVGYGTGLSTDTNLGVSYELDHYTWYGYRAEYHLENGIYGLLSVANGKMKFIACQIGGCQSASEVQVGYGAGIGFSVSSRIDSEIVFGTFDDTKVMSATLKWAF